MTSRFAELKALFHQLVEIESRIEALLLPELTPRDRKTLDKAALYHRVEENEIKEPKTCNCFIGPDGGRVHSQDCQFGTRRPTHIVGATNKEVQALRLGGEKIAPEPPAEPAEYKKRKIVHECCGSKSWRHTKTCSSRDQAQDNSGEAENKDEVEPQGATVRWYCDPCDRFFELPASDPGVCEKDWGHTVVAREKI
jgi:hypothetical protein